MKIAVDIRTLMDARYSGVSEYTRNLLGKILELDNSNEYRLFYTGSKRRKNLEREWTRPNAEVVWIRYPNKFLNYCLFKIFNYPKLDKRLGADVYWQPHINFAGLAEKGSAAPMAKRILTIHDLSYLRYPEYFSARKNFWHGMVDVRKLAGKFDLAVAVSESTKRDVVELCGFDESRVKVIHSGLDEEIFNFKHETLKEVKNKYNLPGEFVLFLGTIEPRKNIKGLIKAFNLFKVKNSRSKIKLVIAGMKGWKTDDIYGEWEKSPFKNEIIFLGYVDEKDKPYLYRLAALFTYPSFYEGFGHPPLEACASGTPVITSQTSSLSEVAGGAAIMIDPHNPADLAAAMGMILSDKNLCADLSRRGLEQAKKFSWHKTAEEFLKLLR